MIMAGSIRSLACDRVGFAEVQLWDLGLYFLERNNLLAALSISAYYFTITP